MIYLSGILQLNAACRAARQFPELAVSRLLMSLNDEDIPILLPNAQQQRLKSWTGRIEQGMIVVLLVLVSSPLVIQVRLHNVSCYVIDRFLYLL